MKKITIILFATIILFGCVNNENENKDEINNVSKKDILNDNEIKEEETNSNVEISNNNEEDIENLSFELIMSSFDGDFNKVKEYLAKGADINFKEPIYNVTALFFALKGNNTEIARYLIEHGADINLGANENTTPLMAAILTDNTEIVNLLIKKGADVNRKEIDGKTALLFAVYKDNVDYVRLMLEHGAEVNVEFLYRENSEVPVEEGVKKTILQVAKEMGNKEIIELLIQAGAKE